MNVTTEVAIVDSSILNEQRRATTCLVTGGSGFIGKQLVKRLAEDGNNVIVLDKLVDSAPFHSNVSYRKCSILDAQVWRYLENNLANVEVIFHLAGVTRTPLAVRDPITCMEVNVMGTVRMLEFARVSNVKRIVFASSNVVYAFDTAYKISKLAGEGMCDVYNNLYGQSTIALRFSNVYGPGMKRGDCAVFASLRDSAVLKKYIEITGDGEQTRDFTHVDDIVDGCLKAWKSTYRGTLDLCTGINTSLNEIAKYFHASNSTVEIRYVADRPGDYKYIRQDPSIAKQHLGWHAKIKLKDGLPSIWKLT